MPGDVAFNIALYAKTDTGQVRSGNEDNFLVLNLSTADTWVPHATEGEPAPDLTTFTQSHYGSVLAVTDGMGGALAGEVASRLAVECVRDRMLELQASPTYSRIPFHERLRLSIELANAYIHQMSSKRREYAGMGATFTAVGLSGSTAYFAQVGDSRAYLIRSKELRQVTKDQSLVGQLIQAGHLTEEEAASHSYKNVILQALGASPKIDVEIVRMPIREMDILVLCSDGLTNKVRGEEIHEIINQAPSLKEACEDLIALSNERGGEDNITVLIVQFSGGNLSHAGSGSGRNTAPLTSSADSSSDWEPEQVPRDPDLPSEIDAGLLDDEEDTLRP